MEGLWLTSALGEAGGFGSALSSRTLFMELMLPLSCTTSPSPTVTGMCLFAGATSDRIDSDDVAAGFDFKGTSRSVLDFADVLPVNVDGPRQEHSLPLVWPLYRKILAPPPGMLRPTLRRVLLDQGA